MRGEHTETILRDVLGYDERTIIQLAQTAAFGVPAAD
jgi:hypothetical protein